MQDSLSFTTRFSPSPAAQQCRDALSTWFLQEALPFWWAHGVDLVRGGFHEKIGPEGRPLDEPRRTRVTSRQIYVFTVAHRLGWNGPALQAVKHGLDFLLQRQRRADGTFASAVTPDGRIVDECFDLYEQAFALFALAEAYRVQPAWDHLPLEAEALYGVLARGWRHPLGGFQESSPASVPLKSNPHMHLLEALLAWCEVAPAAQRAAWLSRAGELVTLCLARLIDPVSGALREYFDGQWHPMPGEAGRIVEPGHQFEWAWLLLRWDAAVGQPRATEAARRLVALAEARGIGPHGTAVNELLDDFSVRDGASKLWPQTERIKAWAALLSRASTDQDRIHTRDGIAQACAGLMPYLRQPPCQGTWQEAIDDQGHFVSQPCRASSLYHIVCAIDTLHALPTPLLSPPSSLTP